ncbi:tRNA (adenosine(37)-N6)-dimethylallyltransferase MiaA [Prevotella sp. S7 MS 2]|uniref:tRNA (adenosine(37)-N6)-dimethylallyltransferase MiaA n=1 Tax=Prevotella sp. S7 MS 2 TaxID=1287488 RepID=UPI000513D40D|nr:tRNA (adenosine(37)-N6)-dimethylallyltransferase MiaA [Prevotella sp. S7 MS 2]KGI60270.1 tRNA delta(2)-isopentenylpyrophosphate transferase [Prevotella sp. S7 MS 2]
MDNTLIVILGPTGVGKTALCIDLAKHFASPIVNADSRQIFAEMPIGTAAPTLEQQNIVKHYFVGNHKITDYYSAAMYEHDVLQLLPTIFTPDHSKVILTGGSMMYIDAVCKGIDDIPTVTPEIREQVMSIYQQHGLDYLVDMLQQLDPEHWAIVDKQNPRRVIHAIEICMMTGKTYSSFRTNTHKKRPFNIIKIGLNRERDILYQRINERVLQMMEQGLLEEVKSLLPYRHLNALNTVGYKELFNYLDGNITLEEAVRQIQSNTRRYMRKQLTWFKRDCEITWFSPDNIKEIINYIESKT